VEEVHAKPNKVRTGEQWMRGLEYWTNLCPGGLLAFSVTFSWLSERLGLWIAQEINKIGMSSTGFAWRTWKAHHELVQNSIKFVFTQHDWHCTGTYWWRACLVGRRGSCCHDIVDGN